MEGIESQSDEQIIGGDQSTNATRSMCEERKVTRLKRVLSNKSSSSEVSKKRLTSDVWKYFSREESEVNGLFIAVCQFCKKKFFHKSSSGTKNLRTHLEKCPEKQQQHIDLHYKKIDYNVVDGSVQITSSFDQERARRNLVNMIIMHEYPLNMVEHIGFKMLVNSLQPKFQMFSQNTLKSDILKIYDFERVKTLSLLEANRSRVAISTDIWTSSNQQKGFMAVTAHFIDDNWIIQSRVMRFIYVPCPHTARVLAETLMDCLVEWNVDCKLSTLTVDNCSTNDAMIEILLEKLVVDSLLLHGKLFHMRCTVDVLNLIVKDGMDVINESIERIRSSVLYWTTTPKREETFVVVARKLNIPYTKKLVADCKTRWNSTYLMLDSALIYKDVFPHLKQLEPQYKCLPIDEDWMFAKEIHAGLESFYLVTTLFSETKYPIANLFFPNICEIKLSIQQWLNSDCDEVKNIAVKMAEKFEKYWSVVHGITAMAIVLDPRYKLKLVEYYFQLLYDSVWKDEVEKIRGFCNELFMDYQSRYKKNEEVVQFQNTTLFASSSQSKSAHSLLDQRLANFDVLVSQTASSSATKCELDYYLEENVIPRSAQFDILYWWKVYGSKFPTLQQIARDILAIPISTVASKSSFSTNGRFVTPHRSRLHPKILEALMCAQNWLWAEINGFSWQTEKFNYSEDADVMDKEKEEVELALEMHLGSMKCGKEIQSPESRSLQVQFVNNLSLPVFTDARIEGEDSPLKVALVDSLSGEIVTSGPESSARVEIVVLEGDFDGDESYNWTVENFKNNIVREREGKKPLLTGDAFLTLKEGIGLVSEISFTDNSSWTRSHRFRLGARVVDKSNETRVREAKTESFIVRDHCGEFAVYKKHHPPFLLDEVWRLEKIGKDGAFHKRLSLENINTVKDFLTLLVLDPPRLRHILGTGMSANMWEVTAEHARTCVLNKRMYFYCPSGTQQTSGVVFNVVGQVMGLLSECQYAPIDNLSEAQKVEAVNLVICAFKHWEEVVSFEEEASLTGGSPLLPNVVCRSSLLMTDVSSGSKVPASHKMGGSDFTQLNASSPDIISSIYSAGGVSGWYDYNLPSIENMGLRYERTFSYPGQITNSLIRNTESISEPSCDEDYLQFFDTGLFSLSLSLDSRADLQSAVDGFLLEHYSASRGRWRTLFSVLKWFSIRKLVTLKRTRILEIQRYTNGL